jgi:lipoyl(octanoyl) transferase
MSEPWLFLEHGPKPPAWNMACDEWLLKSIQNLGQPILRTYQWNRPSITIGYFQDYPKDLEAKYTIIRRPTGGALVVHDHDLTFTVVLPPEHPWKKIPVCDRYQRVHERVAQIFAARGESSSLETSCSSASIPSGRADKLGYCFQKSSRYDVLIQGKKVAGGAQRVTREGLLHQGSIQSEAHPIATSAELKASWEKSGDELKPLILDSSQENEIQHMAKEKYETVEWNKKSQ